MKIYFVTSNPHKLSAVKSFFKTSGIQISGYKMNLPEIQSENQKEILKLKLEHAWHTLHKPVIADDTGIYIKKYNNFPGTNTKQIILGLGIKGIHKIIENDEPAFYRTMIGFANKDGIKLFEGVLEGKLKRKIPKKINPKAFFSSIFVPVNEKLTLAEISDLMFPSHRAKALAKLKNYLMKQKVKK